MYVLLLVGGLGLSMGVHRVRPGWLQGNRISGLNDDGDNAVFLVGCMELEFRLLVGLLMYLMMIFDLFSTLLYLYLRIVVMLLIKVNYWVTVMVVLGSVLEQN